MHGESRAVETPRVVAGFDDPFGYVIGRWLVFETFSVPRMSMKRKSRSVTFSSSSQFG